jgi:hypothetical protein
MRRTLPRWTCSGLAASLLVAAGVLAQDSDSRKKDESSPDRQSPRQVARDAERASGVIVKAEAIRKGAASRLDDTSAEKARGASHRLTINTAAVWRDWARDQVGLSPDAPPREQARRGNNSVATKGEPQSADTLLVVDVGPNTKIETRFRASTDETSKGARTPAAAAREAVEDPAAEKEKAKGKEGRDSSRRDGEGRRGRITRIHADDLQPGLFVEVDFELKDARNLASSLAVIRPVGGPDDAPAEPAAGQDRTKKER